MNPYRVNIPLLIISVLIPNIAVGQAWTRWPWWAQGLYFVVSIVLIFYVLTSLFRWLTGKRKTRQNSDQ